MFKVIKVKSQDELNKEAFKVMRQEVKPGAVLGLATGSSPVGLYKEMMKDHQENGTSYAEVTTFNLDEDVGVRRERRVSY